MFLKKLFGTSSQRYIKKLMPIVDQINERFQTLESKSDQDLINRTIELKTKVNEARNEAKNKFGKIHSVIFATVPFLHIMPVLEAKPEDFYYTLDADIKGFYHVLKAVVPILKESGGGSITALTTAAIHRYISTDGLSSIPKSGVQHLCTAIAREEGHHGIRANCVAVGLIAVGLSQEIDSPPGGILDQWMNQVPLGRAGAPEELFETVVFLASENAGYISGQSLPVDGGYSA